MSDDDEHRRSELIAAALRVIERRVAAEGPERARILPFSWLTPDAVAAEASISTEVFDQLMNSSPGQQEPSLSAFESFLLDALTIDHRDHFTESRTRGLSHPDDTLEEYMRIDAACPMPKSIDWTSYRTSLCASALSGHKRNDYEEYLAAVTQICQFTLYRFGREMREPLRVEHLALNMAAVFEGAWLRRLTDVEDPSPSVTFSVDGSEEAQEWTVDSISAWSIVIGMTRPIGSADASPYRPGGSTAQPRPEPQPDDQRSVMSGQ